ncbi:penicillin-binding protein 2 [Patescibacteria group bacterium]|nr:penicillin-binding protein 2 [Patescibacteria group bacterium]
MNKNRLKTLTMAIIGCFLVIIGRFFFWQVIKSGELRRNSMLQSYKIEISEPSRGLIFTQDNFPIAQNQTLYRLSLYKPNFQNPLETILQKITLSKPDFISENQKAIDKFKSDDTLKWYTFPQSFTFEEQAGLTLPGLSFSSFTNRYYPENNLAKPLVTGLESYYQKLLAGKPGFFRLSKDALGNALLLDTNWQTQGFPGKNLHLYLNRQLQNLTEKTIKEGIEKYQADSGSITIMDPATGGILAMASFTATSSATPSAFANPIISKLFEPGSIFKPIVMAEALDLKSITPDFICTGCNKPKVVGSNTITNWDNATHPDSTLQDIIKNSDNIGMSYIIETIGLNRFLQFYQKMGLNQKTGIDLQGEAKPVLKKSWSQIDLDTASFGQGIAITQLQMLTAFNTIANNGAKVYPKMVEFLDDDRDTVNSRNLPSTQIYSPATITLMKSILKYAVENGVVGKFKPKNLEVCAKSGTAQIAINGSYSSDNSIASYIGFSPCNHPKFTMIVTIDNPRTSPWGSSTAAPIWFDLASQISNSPL